MSRSRPGTCSACSASPRPSRSPGLLVVRPEQGLFLLWQLVIPIVPAVFLVAPGLWRNVCPLAALNQLPRVAGFTKGLTHTPAIREYSFVIGIAAFFALVSARKFLFNADGATTAALILAALGLAFLGGVVFKGKSGWCSSVCPLLPVQRLYGQTPFVTVPNSHCRPCVGCTKNCYDFNPKVAYLADQYDDDRRYVGYRRFFAAVFPGFVAAFYLVPDPPAVTVPRMYFEFAAYMAVSLAAFTTLETFAKVRVNTLTALFAAVAFNVYYWFSAETHRRRRRCSRRDDAGAAPGLGHPRRGACGHRRLAGAHAARRASLRGALGGDRERAGRAARRGRRDRAREGGDARARAGVVQARGQAGRHRAGPDAARDRRAVRPHARIGLPDGDLRRRPGRDPGGHGERLRAR